MYVTNHTKWKVSGATLFESAPQAKNFGIIRCYGEDFPLENDHLRCQIPKISRLRRAGEAPKWGLRNDICAKVGVKNRQTPPPPPTHTGTPGNGVGVNLCTFLNPYEPPGVKQIIGPPSVALATSAPSIIMDTD